MQLCANCQSLNADTAKFCSDCASPLTVASEPVATSQTELEPVNQKGVKLLGAFFLAIIGVFVAGMMLTSTSTEKAQATNKMINLQVTASHYERMQKGMTLAECNRLIGLQGQEQSRAGDGQYEIVTVSWVNWTGSNITAMFQGGKMISKAQFGLQ